MALEYSKVQSEATAIEDVCNQTVSLLATYGQLLEHNSDLAIDWAAGAKPAYINEQANGNLEGKTYSRQQVANAIGTLTLIRKILLNQDVTGLMTLASPGDHLGNLNLLTRPLG